MKYLFLLLLLPQLGFTQKVNEFWVTPIAEITFEESRIVYSYSADECNYDTQLKPVHYSEQLLSLRSVTGIGCMDNFREMHEKVYSYVGNWGYGSASNMDKEHFLKCVALLIIWQYRGKSVLPENTAKTVESMQWDMSLQISRAAKQVLTLYEFYQPLNKPTEMKTAGLNLK